MEASEIAGQLLIPSCHRLLVIMTFLHQVQEGAVSHQPMSSFTRASISSYFGAALELLLANCVKLILGVDAAWL